jgi:DNA invertase Pin-like site-specific DNA recombinase
MKALRQPERDRIHVAIYTRVSTGRQAEQDLSIPDQLATDRAYADRNGWIVIDEFIEPGASAMDDNRPEFQRMIGRALDDDRPYDIILVHSFSRIFRSTYDFVVYDRILSKKGVSIKSATQEFGDDPSQNMLRTFIAVFDEYQSQENAKHTLRAMKENARNGYYNGSPVPLGYKTVETEKRGSRTKKRIDIDPVEAETIRFIFDLARNGTAETGPLGVKKITSYLNSHGYRTRRGSRFGVGGIHNILTNTVYIGQWKFMQSLLKRHFTPSKSC